MFSHTKFSTLMKSSLFAAVFMMAVNVCDARVYIGVGVGGGGYPYSCQPGYWDNGFWVAGTCGDSYYPAYNRGPYYPNYYPGSSYIYWNFGGGHHDHHHGDHWHHN